MQQEGQSPLKRGPDPSPRRALFYNVVNASQLLRWPAFSSALWEGQEFLWPGLPSFQGSGPNVRQKGNVLRLLGFSYVKALLSQNLKLSYQSKCEGQPRQRLLLGPNFLLIAPSSWAAEIRVYLEPNTIWTISPCRPGLGLCLMRMLSAERRPAVLFP